MTRKLNLSEKMPYKEYKGEIEIIVKDRSGNVIDRIVEPNIVKIFAKECLAHTLPYSKVWDPNAGTGVGAWVESDNDPDEEFAVKYILLGASFDDNGVPLDAEDERYYTYDEVSGTYIPIRLDPGAHYGGGLINAIPISEPSRPLKRIERIAHETTYQPAGTPLLQDDVRAINNIMLVETTLRPDEYNGFGASDSDFFTITEVALAAGRTFDEVDQCECTPRELFLDGPYAATASGGDVVTLDNAADADKIKEGDQIKITATGSNDDTLDQVNPFYLIMEKAESGRDMVLDRVPVDSEQNPLSGVVDVHRDTLRIFSHRILKSPAKKTGDFEITIRWRIIFS